MRKKRPNPTRSREHKVERMELRLRPSARRIIERAMSVSGLGAADLLYEGARRVLAEHESMVLTGADRDAFLNACETRPRRQENSSRRSNATVIFSADAHRVVAPLSLAGSFVLHG